MKKLIALMLLVVSSAASAADVSVGVGHNKAVNADVANVQVGTNCDKLSVAGELEYARNVYTSYGLRAAYPVFTRNGFTLSGFGGVAYMTPNTFANGFVAKAGVEGMYSLTSNTHLYANYGRAFALDNAANAFRGNTYTLGLRAGF